MFMLFAMRREKMRNNHQNVQASSQEFLGTVSVIIPLVHVHLRNEAPTDREAFLLKFEMWHFFAKLYH